MPNFWNKKPYKKNTRADHQAGARGEFERNKRKILMSQEICGICGKPVDKSLKYPNPEAPVIDHIIPLKKGGHPCSLYNLQLAHARCNRLKGDTLPTKKTNEPKKTDADYYEKLRAGLPQQRDWLKYRPKN